MSKVLSSLKEDKGIENKDAYEVDANGYFKVTFGMFNAFNGSGIFYRVKNLDDVAGLDSLVGGRVKLGQLRSEWKHPNVDGMGNKALQARTVHLDIDRVCAHIKKVEIEDTGEKDRLFGLPVYKVYGWVKPEGPMGDYLREALENPDANVSFSIRSLVKQSTVGSTTVRDIHLISTWDYVYAPGVPGSTQWDSVGIEEFVINVTDEDLEELKAGIESAGECKDGACVLKALKKMKDKQPLLNL